MPSSLPPSWPFLIFLPLANRILEHERKKKKKFHHTTSASKEKLKYYELILKRIQGFQEEGTLSRIETPELNKKH